MIQYTHAQITEKLTQFQGWEYVEGGLHTSFEFENFKEAFSAMTRIAFEAERLNHHPKWTNVYNTSTSTLLGSFTAPSARRSWRISGDGKIPRA